MQRVGPALVVLATIASTLVNVAVAVWRWVPSFFQLGLCVVWMCVPAVLACLVRKTAAANGLRGLACLVVAVATMSGGAAVLTLVPSGWGYLLVPFAQLCVLVFLCENRSDAE